MKISNIILGSGLVALLARKILGDTWTIVPFGPSKFYATGVPAWGDDFIMHDSELLDTVADLGLQATPLFLKRPISCGGELLYNDAFLPDYLNRMGIEDNPLTRSRFRSDLTVFPFSCLQLWQKLLPQFVNEIRGFFNKYPVKGLERINDGTLQFKGNDGNPVVVEYDRIISTVPYHVLSDLMGEKDQNRYADLYHYFLDADIDQSGADQVLVCDEVIPFHRSTKIARSKYLIEVVGMYHENPMAVFQPIFGTNFDILKANLIEKGYAYPGTVNVDLLFKHKVQPVGSLAQVDPLMDIASCIKRIRKLANGGF